MFRSSFFLSLALAGFLTSCASTPDEAPTPNAEVISSHAGIYIRIPSTNPPKTAPYLYLQQGMGVYRTGKTRRGYERVIVADGLSCWVDETLLGPVGSAPVPEEQVERDYSRPKPRPTPNAF